MSLLTGVCKNLPWKLSVSLEKQESMWLNSTFHCRKSDALNVLRTNAANTLAFLHNCTSETHLNCAEEKSVTCGSRPHVSAGKLRRQLISWEHVRVCGSVWELCGSVSPSLGLCTESPARILWMKNLQLFPFWYEHSSSLTEYWLPVFSHLSLSPSYDISPHRWTAFCTEIESWLATTNIRLLHRNFMTC